MKVNKGLIIGTLILLIFVLTMVFNFQSSLVGNRKIAGFRAYTVEEENKIGGLDIGDLLIVTKKKNETESVNLAINDVAVYKIKDKRGSYFGRVKELGEDEVTFIDGKKVELKRIIGKMEKVIPKVGYLFIFIKNPIVLSVIVIFFAFEIIRSIIRNLKNNKAPSMDNN